MSRKAPPSLKASRLKLDIKFYTNGEPEQRQTRSYFKTGYNALIARKLFCTSHAFASWNLNGRVSALCDQINSLGELQPDIVALQEVLAVTAPRFREGLGQTGLVHSFELWFGS